MDWWRPTKYLLALRFLLHSKFPYWCPPKLCQKIHHCYRSRQIRLWSNFFFALELFLNNYFFSLLKMFLKKNLLMVLWFMVSSLKAQNGIMIPWNLMKVIPRYWILIHFNLNIFNRNCLLNAQLFCWNQQKILLIIKTICVQFIKHLQEEVLFPPQVTLPTSSCSFVFQALNQKVTGSREVWPYLPNLMINKCLRLLYSPRFIYLSIFWFHWYQI